MPMLINSRSTLVNAHASVQIDGLLLRDEAFAVLKKAGDKR